MLRSRLERLERLSERRYIAEPKLNGQRAQVHIRNRRTVACYSRPGRDLLRHAGMAWLREARWPTDTTVLDGEACAGDGHEGTQAVFELRSTSRTGWGRLIVSLSVLAACSPGIGIYNKPGLTYTEWKRDDSECRRDAGENGGGAIDREAYARCLRDRGYKIRPK